MQSNQCIRGCGCQSEITEIVSCLPFCHLQDCFTLSGQGGGGRTDASMEEIIEEAVTKYLEIIKKRRKPKRGKKKKEILPDEKHRENGDPKITRAEEVDEK